MLLFEVLSRRLTDMFSYFLQEGTTFVKWFQVPKLYVLPLIGVIVVAIVLLHYLVGISQYPREPPFVPQKFLYVGHLIGILWHRTKYYDILRLAPHPAVLAHWMRRHEWLFVVQRNLCLPIV